MNYINDPLSNVQISQAIKKMKGNDANIITDTSIKPDTSLEKIFKGQNHCILFHKWNKNEPVGHWYTLLRYDNTIFFADSLAHKPDYYNKNILTCFKNDGINEVIVNNTPWQKGQSAVCGRYGILLTCLRRLNIPIDGIYAYMNSGKKTFGSYDAFVLDMTT